MTARIYIAGGPQANIRRWRRYEGLDFQELLLNRSRSILLFRYSKKFGEIFLPDRRDGVGTMTARLIGYRQKNEAAVLNAFYCLFDYSQLRWVNLVIRRIYGE